MLFRLVLSLPVLTAVDAGAESGTIDVGYIANGDHTLRYKTMGAGDGRAGIERGDTR